MKHYNIDEFVGVKIGVKTFTPLTVLHCFYNELAETGVKNKKSCIEMQDLWWSIPDSNR